MSMPAPADFVFEKTSSRWIASTCDAAFDLVLPDENGKPLRSAITLLERALANLDVLLPKAQEYIQVFCSASDPQLMRMPEIVEISVVRRGQSLTVFLSLFYEHDLYGRWSVGFVLAEPNDWYTFSFMREQT